MLEAKREVLKEFKIDYWEDLQYSQFGKAKDIIANKLEIDYFYYEYEIILNKEGLKEFITEDYSTLKKVLNKKIQEKTKASKQGNLKFLTDGEKDVYVEYFISTETDYKLREKKTMNGHKTEALIVEPREYQKEIKYSTIGHICDIQSDKRKEIFMNVKELIEQLQKVKNKSLPVKFFGYSGYVQTIKEIEIKKIILR